MEDKFVQLQTEYERLRDDILTEPSGTTAEEIRDFYLVAATLIWSENEAYSPDYGTLMNLIAHQTFTPAQILTALQCAHGDRQLQIPPFLVCAVQLDRAKGTERTINLIARWNELLVATAMINGDFTLAEASTVTAILYGWMLYAKENGVPTGRLPDNSHGVTDRKEDSYQSVNEPISGNDSVKEEPTKLKSKPMSEDDEDEEEEDEEEEYDEDEEDDDETITFSINVNDLWAAYDEDEDSDDKPILPDKNETLDSLLDQLDKLIGLESVKRDVRSLINFIKIIKLREKRGMKTPTISYHLVFTGNPGTGKTTVARLIAKLYYRIGLLPKGQFVEADRSTLVGGYLGQTALKTKEVIQKALGGVLFIDEAYSLANKDQDTYGGEAIETLLKSMEDHRNELVVIVAGYTDLMKQFLASNPGLSSRFSKVFEFPDYTGEALYDIFLHFCDENGYTLDPAAREMLTEQLNRMFQERDEHFGNARSVRNLFEKAINEQANRLANEDDLRDTALETITAKDIEIALGGNI